MKLNWIGEAFKYGRTLEFFSITSFGVEQIFYIFSVSDDESDDIFKVEYLKEINTKVIETTEEIEEPVKAVYLINTDDDFRKKMKRSYYLLKFVTDNEVFTIGIYNDNGKKPTVDNSYLLCTTDFVNVLARAEKITGSKQIENTPFAALGSLFNKNELTKKLLK
jgi:hypothetical protein